MDLPQFLNLTGNLAIKKIFNAVLSAMMTWWTSHSCIHFTASLPANVTEGNLHSVKINEVEKSKTHHWGVGEEGEWVYNPQKDSLYKWLGMISSWPTCLTMGWNQNLAWEKMRETCNTSNMNNIVILPQVTFCSHLNTITSSTQISEC